MVFGIVRLGLHPLDAGNNSIGIVHEQASKRCFNPLPCFLAVFPVLRAGQVVQVFAAMKKIQHLFGIWIDLVDSIPDPLGAVTDDPDPDLVFRNQPGLLDLQKIVGQRFVVFDLVPADQMNHLLIIEQIHAKAFDFLPLALAPLAFPGARFRPCGRMGAIDADHQNRATESAFGKLLDFTMNFRSIRANVQQLNVGCDIVDHIVNVAVAQFNARAPQAWKAEERKEAEPRR